MARISWTEEAEAWLREIFDYIAADDPATAARVIEGIYEKAQVLHRFPHIGYRYDSGPRNPYFALWALPHCLELAQIGSLLFVFADSPNDQTGFSSTIDTFATRLSA